MAAIEFHQVTRRYPGSESGVIDVSFAVTAGEMLYLTGPSGAGKSTLMNLIAGTDRANSGSVRVQGQDLARIGRTALPYLRRRLGLIQQAQNLLLDRTVLQNVMLPLLVSDHSPKEARQRAKAALDRVGLLDKASAMPPSLSGGEQQRVAIARAIVHRPQIILADEPTANLDRESADQVLNILRAFNRAGVTCLISTHDAVFLATAPRVLQLQRGRLVSDALARVPA